MNDISMKAELVGGTKIFVSPIHEKTYLEHVPNENLGSASGYFVSRERRNEFEVLAKAVSLDAAREIFILIVTAQEE